MKIILNITRVFLVSTVLFCTYKIMEKTSEYREADIVYNHIREEKEKIENKKTEETLFDKYEDYRGWISIANTNIDYPILQSTDNSYYLKRDINKDYLASGSIFMHYLNDNFNDKNTVIFGHYMKNDTMFGQLKQYKNKDFFKNNNEILITTKDKILKYRVFSVYVTNANDPYIRTDFEDANQYSQFLNTITNKSLYKSDITVNENDRILTLSTCSYEFKNARLAIHAKLVESTNI